MPRQINLYNPILLTPRRHFSAVAMAQALGVFVIALLLLGGWAVLRTRTLQSDLASTDLAHRTQLQQLQQAVAGLPAPTDTATLEQEAAQLRQRIARHERWLSELQQAPPGTPEALAWLRRLARSTPGNVWLTEVRVDDARVELIGMTLQPDALRPWLEGLAGDASPRGVPFDALRVERATTPTADAWSFQAVRGGAPVPSGARP